MDLLITRLLEHSENQFVSFYSLSFFLNVADPHLCYCFVFMDVQIVLDNGLISMQIAIKVITG